MFRLDYKGQSLKYSLKFNLWKKRMLQKYGNDAKLFKCSYDKTFFFSSNEDFGNMPLYSCKCPSCNKSICYYRSGFAYDRNAFGKCCLKRRIYYKFFYDGFLFIKGENESFKKYFLIFLLPFCTFFLLVGVTCCDFFYMLKDKKSINHYKIHYFKDTNFFWFSILINGLMAIILLITYSIFSLNFKIFLFFISIFTKIYPIKFYLGIIKGGLNHLD